MNRIIWIALLLAVADGWSTWYGVTSLGLVEGNPVYVFLFTLIGFIPGLLACALFTVAFTGALVYGYRKTGGEVFVIAAVVFLLVKTVAVVSNLLLIT
jgi:hypothetical protein